MFYGGYGATLIPAFGIIDAYGGFTPEYYNALGFFVLCELHPSFRLTIQHCTVPAALFLRNRS